jgi:DNA segregation ATPase FtsK/SpoIIIE, S-DNA-T family
LVVAGSLEELKTEMRGVIAEAKKAKAGLLLSPPSTLDGDVVGVRLTKNLVGRTPPGRGLLARHGEVEVIQVPLPEA